MMRWRCEYLGFGLTFLSRAPELSTDGIEAGDRLDDDFAIADDGEERTLGSSARRSLTDDTHEPTQFRW
jgi:hypothetical protein